jgi:hypothetical protein
MEAPGLVPSLLSLHVLPRCILHYIEVATRGPLRKNPQAAVVDPRIAACKLHLPLWCSPYDLAIITTQPMGQNSDHVF